MATATSTVAPPGGVDCDGDGVPDLIEGMPLVCRVQSDTLNEVVELEGPLTRLLSSRTFVRRDAVDVVADGADVVPLGDYTSLDLHASHQLPFRATFSCAGRAEGDVAAIPVTARVGGLEVARSEV